jgi:hypothetical protein
MTWGSDLYLRKVREATSAGRAQWELRSELHFNSEILGPLTVPQGFRTDCASVPRVPIAYLFFGDTAHASAVLHDWLYRHHPCTRAQADAVFLEAMQAEGVRWWRAQMMHRAVRLFGRRSND